MLDFDPRDYETFYAGLGRERELEHDLQVYRAYERAEDHLLDRGAHIERVVLDHELKSEYQRWLHERDKDHDDYDGHPDHRWLTHRDAVFAGPSSRAIAEALNSGRGRVESVVLPHVYRHLAPLVADTPARPEPVNRGLRRGPTGENTPRHAINPRPQPPPEEPVLSIREQCERDWHRLNEFYKAQKA
jgi:hypothetical protein